MIATCRFSSSSLCLMHLSDFSESEAPKSAQLIVSCSCHYGTFSGLQPSTSVRTASISTPSCGTRAASATVQPPSRKASWRQRSVDSRSFTAS